MLTTKKKKSVVKPKKLTGADEQLVERKEVNSLTAAELIELKRAYRTLYAISDNRGYNHIAGYHGVPGFYCHADDEIFLPWHRAYVHNLELDLRDVTDNVAIPYWDWTTDVSHSSGVPAVARNASESDGQSNPFFQSRISTNSVNRFSRRDAGRPIDLVNFCQATKDRIRDLLSISDFMDFSMELQQFPHNAIHGWLGGNGGDMGNVNFAAYDPIFFFHHCMIDRIWYLWQKKYGVDTMPTSIKNKSLSPFGILAKDVLDIQKLGYKYI